MAGLGYLGYWATMVWANGLGKATRDIKVIGFDKASIEMLICHAIMLCEYALLLCFI